MTFPYHFEIDRSSEMQRGGDYPAKHTDSYNIDRMD
jgi:hypothetical protein